MRTKVETMKSLIGYILTVSLITGCGDGSRTPTDSAMDTYLFGPLRSECVSDGSSSSISGEVLGRSFVEIHKVRFVESGEPADRSNANLNGSIERIIYHDGNCTIPALTIELDGEVSRAEKTETGFRFWISPSGTMIPHDDTTCRFLVDKYRWADKGITCSVGQEYRRDAVHLGESELNRIGNKEVSRLHYLIRNGEDGGVIVLGPRFFFDIVTRYRLAGADVAALEPSYKLIPQGARLPH